MNRYSNSSSDSKARENTRKEYLGNYIGIVIQNNDPDKRGRVKVYVPHISSSVYEKWIKSPIDKKFSFLGNNIDSDLNVIVDELKEVLPWASCAAPLIGSTGSGRYNANQQTGSISDSSKLTTTAKSTRTQYTKYGLNEDGIGEKPARIYEAKELEVHDGFNTTVDGISGAGAPNKVNKYSYQYKPSSYSNQPKGSFSIPNVGAHIWVFFQNGDPMKPVYFASSFSTVDWNQIYDSTNDMHGPDYPGSYENKNSTDSTYNHNTETYRNKYVLSQKGGTLEIVNTDNREILKLTHYSGSFKEFNNEATIELATGQDQKLVQGHQYSTVKGHRNDITYMDYDQLIRGDYYRKVGTFNHGKFEEWQSELRLLADLKQLFELKRVEYLQDDDDNIYLPKISPLQHKEGNGGNSKKPGHGECPVCTHKDRPKYWDVDNGGTTFRIPSITTIANQSLGVMTGFVQPITLLPKVFELIQPPASPTNFLESGDCPCCGGDGVSPSTSGGTFTQENKNNLISEEVHSRIKKLTEIERSLGLGGSEIVNITKHKVENIGLVMNDFPSIRVDKIGKLVPSEVLVLKRGVITNQKAVPLIEYVHTDEMPGGSYTLNCANKFNVQAGANGISFKTYGPVDIGGTIVNIAGEQVNIASDNEVNINAGRVSIVADILHMRQRQYKQVLVEGNLGITQNAVIKGSLHVEGECHVQHLTAPMEMKETDGNRSFGEIMPVKIGGCYVGYGSSGGWHPVFGIGASPMANKTYNHSHVYEGLPVTMMKDSDSVRSVAMQTAAQMETPPAAVQNGNLFTMAADKLGAVVDGAVGDFSI
tara:strand:+ start:1195 stop:3645 length:2451 start_codon:yes stop_codon:yes gene_type:complete